MIAIIIAGVFLSYKLQINLTEVKNFEQSIKSGHIPPLLVILTCLIYGMQLMYYATEIFQAASPGKSVLGFYIGDENGNPASTSALFIRFILKHGAVICVLAGTLIFNINYSLCAMFFLLSSLMGVIIGLGAFLILGPGRQTLHDKLSGEQLADYLLGAAIVGSLIATVFYLVH